MTASARDADARALSARELVRVTPAIGRIESDAHEQIGHVVRDVRLADDAVHARRFADDLLDPHLRVQRSVRILEDHLNRRRHAALRAQGGATVSDLALARLVQPAAEPAQRALAAARLADESDHFALRDREAHAVDRVHRVFRDVRAERARELFDRVEPLDEALRHAAEFEQRRIDACRGRQKATHRTGSRPSMPGYSSAALTTGRTRFMRRSPRRPPTAGSGSAPCARCTQRARASSRSARPHARSARGTRSRAQAAAAKASCRESG